MSIPPHSNYILLEDHDAVFCYVPKVACTNWKCVARRLAGQADWLDPRLAHDKTRSGLIFLDPTDKSQAFLITQCRLRLSMVRDPYTRTLSAYLDKVARRLQDGALMPGSPTDDYWFEIVAAIDRFRRNVLSSDLYGSITFEVFLLWLKHAVHQGVNNEHWAPQSKLITLNAADLSFIGRFEAMSADCARMLEMLSASFSFPSQQDVAFVPLRSSKQLGNHYSSNCISLVNSIFAEDFDVFEYERATSVSELISRQ